MSASNLVKAVTDHERAQEQIEKTKESLDNAIEDAISVHGWRVIDVMKVTGLSRQRITQIRHHIQKQRRTTTP